MCFQKEMTMLQNAKKLSVDISFYKIETIFQRILSEVVFLYQNVYFDRNCYKKYFTESFSGVTNEMTPRGPIQYKDKILPV